jgi:hypothetical protein
MSKYFNKLKQEKEVKMELEVKKELQEIISQSGLKQKWIADKLGITERHEYNIKTICGFSDAPVKPMPIDGMADVARG